MIRDWKPLHHNHQTVIPDDAFSYSVSELQTPVRVIAAAGFPSSDYRLLTMLIMSLVLISHDSQQSLQATNPTRQK